MRYLFIGLLALILGDSLTSSAATSLEMLKFAPAVRSCDLALVQKSFQSTTRMARQIGQGISPSGIVGAATFRTNSCNGNLCQPLQEDESAFDPMLSPDVKDPCVLYCMLRHEWFHFTDLRPWKLDAPETELVVFWELPAYQIEAKCLQDFLNKK